VTDLNPSPPNANARSVTQSARRNLIGLLGAAVLLGAMYLPGLGDYGLYDPWETHYGEVARNMVETENYIDPFWGSPWDPKTVKRERAGFYSKPPLTMWLMSMGMNLFGFNEFGVRFFFPILMITALLVVFATIRHFYTERVAWVGTLVMGTSPFILLMSRQAVTDGPLVAIMTIAMMALAIGLCGPTHQQRASSLLKSTTVVLFLGVSFAQLWAILALDKSPDVIQTYQGRGGWWFEFQWWLKSIFEVAHGKGWFISALLAPAAFWTAVLIWRQTTVRAQMFCLFYVCCGLLVAAKGWLGWAPMGLSIIGYLAITGEWRILREANIGLGLLVVILAGHPWVIAMLCGHHPSWWNRFIIHDHYKRLFAGVHDLDDGAFEYFFQWIGVGMLPWVALLPAAFINLVGRLTSRSKLTPTRRFELLMGLWAVLGFFLFSKSSTKFHHYIFPIIPPLSILVALTLSRMMQGRRRFFVWTSVIALGLLVWVGQDVLRMPNQYQKASTPFTKSFGQLSTQNFVNLFTYKYERQWPIYSSDDTIQTLRAASTNTASKVAKPKTKKKLEQDLEKAQRLESDRARLLQLSVPLYWVIGLSLLGLSLLLVLGLLAPGLSVPARTQWRKHLRVSGTIALAASGLAMAVYCLHIYLPNVSRDWSQKAMWDAYYAHCSKREFNSESERTKHFLTTASRVPTNRSLFPREVCAEPIIAFRTNWRGEAFYSANTILPALEKENLTTFFETYGSDKPFYVFTEKSRIKSELEPTLPKALKGQYTEVFGANVQFVLLRFEGAKSTN
jgi:4-amino-4-deoxy-L-arabinose transferase-like glycosyltransferase